ncbi:hypothetical protein V6N13_003334 [Hibiscus sabdariffa]
MGLAFGTSRPCPVMLSPKKERGEGRESESGPCSPKKSPERSPFDYPNPAKDLDQGHEPGSNGSAIVEPAR